MQILGLDAFDSHTIPVTLVKCIHLLNTQARYVQDKCPYVPKKCKGKSGEMGVRCEIDDCVVLERYLENGLGTSLSTKITKITATNLRSTITKSQLRSTREIGLHDLVHQADGVQITVLFSVLPSVLKAMFRFRRAPKKNSVSLHLEERCDSTTKHLAKLGNGHCSAYAYLTGHS